MKKNEMIRVKMMLSIWTVQKNPAARIDGQMRKVVLDIARHPARHFFLNHHSKAHKSPIVI